MELIQLWNHEQSLVQLVHRRRNNLYSFFYKNRKWWIQIGKDFSEEVLAKDLYQRLHLTSKKSLKTFIIKKVPTIYHYWKKIDSKDPI